MGVIQSYRDLVAWQLGMKLAKGIYVATKRMPSSEQFALTNQMRRAVVSIPSNIAEGYARHSRLDYLKHLRIARGSLAELSTQLELACELEMLPQSKPLSDLVTELDRVL